MMGQKRIKHRPGDIVNKGDLQAVMKDISASMKRYYVPFFLSLFLCIYYTQFKSVVKRVAVTSLFNIAKL